MISRELIDNIEALRLENQWLRLSVIPSLGGKILGVYNKALAKEFLWRNNDLPLTINPVGSDYDSHFIGGIDELIPNDIPQTIDSIEYPDHGELWTTALDYAITGDRLRMSATLPLSGLKYSKSVQLDENSPVVLFDYQITNTNTEPRHFLWKLHAAAVITAGDYLKTGALSGQVIDPSYSRFTNLEPFKWPVIENTDASLVPEKNNTTDFFYLNNAPYGNMHLSANKGTHLFGYDYDKEIFPYQWYFASYGGFLNYYTAILEPCSTMPIDVNEAILKNQCTILQPGETLNTKLRLFAGPAEIYQKQS